MPTSGRFLEMLPQGVLLEDRDILLPWGATREELKALNSDCREWETADRWQLRWPSARVLNGLEIDLSAFFYQIPGDRYRLLDRVDCDHLNDGSRDSALRKYEELKSHILRCCGQPAEERAESVRWQVSAVTISLYIWDHIDCFCALAFSKKLNVSR